MLGPIGSDIMAIFRLLSPDEIDKYIVREEPIKVEQSMRMAANGESMQYSEEPPSPKNKTSKQQPDEEHQAEVIPIRKVKTDHESIDGPILEKELTTDHGQELKKKTSKVSQVPNNDNSPPTSGLEAMGILSASSIKKIEAERLKEENSKKDSATVFLLKEREKMRESKKRMIEQEAIKSYQNSASQEFYEESDDELPDEENQQGLKGILLNKRHY